MKPSTFTTPAGNVVPSPISANEIYNAYLRNALQKVVDLFDDVVIVDAPAGFFIEHIDSNNLDSAFIVNPVQHSVTQNMWHWGVYDDHTGLPTLTVSPDLHIDSTPEDVVAWLKSQNF